jgi:hypothetical protein
MSFLTQSMSRIPGRDSKSLCHSDKNTIEFEPLQLKQLAWERMRREYPVHFLNWSNRCIYFGQLHD